MEILKEERRLTAQQLTTAIMAFIKRFYPEISSSELNEVITALNGAIFSLIAVCVPKENAVEYIQTSCDFLQTLVQELVNESTQ